MTSRQEVAGRALAVMVGIPLALAGFVFVNWVSVGCPPWHIIVQVFGR